MRKALSLLLAGTMAASMMIGSAVTAYAASDMKIAMVTDYGDITDQSFNQTTYEACKAFAEENGYDFTYKKPATDSDADRVSSIEEAVEEGYNVVVLPGYAFAKAIVDVAPTYPDAKFIGLDVSEFDLNSANGEKEFKEDNVYCAVYQEELPGFMAGYAAVKLGYRKLGFLGGMAVPAVIRYGFGFVQGAETAAKELGLKAGDVEMKYAYGGQFFGDADITSAMDTWCQGGTEIVFPCGGGIYTSAAEAAVKTNGKIIGVDSDQKGVIDGSYGDGMTVTSAMKGLTQTVNTVLTAIQNDKWDDYKAQVQSLGLVSENPEENYVQLAPSTQWSDDFNEDAYKELVAKMFKGEYEVSNATDAMPATEIVSVDDQGSIKG